MFTIMIFLKKVVYTKILLISGVPY